MPSDHAFRHAPQDAPQPDPERLLSDIETLKVYFDPVRTRIIQLLANQPRTVQQVADAMNVPFTRLYYQFNLLEKHGLIRVVDTRALSGAVEEKYYQVSARMFVVDRALLTVGERDAQENALDLLVSSILDATRDDLRRSVAAGIIDMAQKPPHPDSFLLRRGVLRLSRERAEAFFERLIALFNEADGWSSGEEETQYAIAIAVYPSAYGHGALEGDEPDHPASPA